MTTESYPQAVQYADLILEVGLNLQPGQRLLVAGSTLGGVDLHLAPFVRIIVERAYVRGAKYVDVVWSDPRLEVTWLSHASLDSIGPYPKWFGSALLEHFEAADAFLMLYAQDPDLLSGVNSELVAAALASVRKTVQDARAYIFRNGINWLVASAPIPAWSAKVLPHVPEADRDLALWHLILEACRLSHPDPLTGWRVHLEALAARARHLTEKEYASLVYSAPGTCLTVGLPRGHIWRGGQAVAENGIPFVPNLPTEEIFTLPHRAQVDGFVCATKPLEYGGKTIDGMSLVFLHGEVVEFSAKAGEETLRELIHADAGAARLGEAALVPHSSPLSQLGIVFHNILFDENASSHLALGNAYRFSLKDAEGLSDEEFAQRGGNQSQVHSDFMIGSAALDVDGTAVDGKIEPIMRGGEWAFDA